jgi:DNA polymerase-3 subunit gamma/tau
MREAMDDNLSDAPPDPAEEPGFDLLGGEAKPPAAREQGYQVLARKYRPATFDDLIGQEAMVRTLSNAFETGRIAHAFMLTGVRGVGKTTTARILARALNYEKPVIDRPTIDMPDFGVHCAAIMESRHPDVMEMDAASRTGIDDIREIIESVRYLPTSARYKVYIIDEVHMLSKAAFNGLLKTLEEPPPHVKFIFATTEIRKVPVTVLSRCQRFDLRRLTLDDLDTLLNRVSAKEHITLEPQASRLLARAADGSARDALSLLDRAIAYSAQTGSEGGVVESAMRDMLGLADRARIFDLFDLVMKGEIAGAMTELRAQYEAGADPVVVMSDLVELTHWLTRLKLVEGAADDLAMSETERERGREMASALSIRTLSRVWQMLLKGLSEVQGAARPVAAAEMVLVRLAYLADGPSPEDLVASLKNNPPSRAPASGGPAASPSGGNERAQLRSVSMTSQRPEPETRVMAAVDAVPRLQRFEDVVALLAEKRDIKLKHMVETRARLVSFEQGRIEIALEEGAPGSIATDLAERLKRWTGTLWVVSLSRSQGAPTLREQARTREERLKDEARQDPLVQAALAAFPGAEIVDVRTPDMDLPDLIYKEGEEIMPIHPEEEE